MGPVYVLDGGVLSVGSALDWLAGIGVDVSPEAHARLAGRGPSPLVVLPALSGTGAPRWDRGATASIAGITAGTDGDDLLQAFLDSFAFRVREIIQAMEGAGVSRPSALKVDGGLTRSAYLMQRQADVLDLPILVSAEDEATALGIAAAAGTSIGTIDLGMLERPPSTVYQPRDPATADSAYHRWMSLAYDRG
jgi:glycerol kinase